MILKSLSLRNAGPFAPKEMRFEEDVTVITGANDTGKSVLLRLIERSLSRNLDSGIEEPDVNFDYLSGCKAAWPDDPSISATITFKEPNGATAVATMPLVPKLRKGASWSRTNWSGSLNAQEIQNFPKVLFVRPVKEDGIRETLSLSSPNAVEQRLLRVAFGAEFNFEALLKLTDLSYQATISRAEANLNARLRTLLPPTLSYSFRFQSFSDKRDQIFVHLIDIHGASTGLGMRGTGIQTLVDLLGTLATENLGGDRVLLLLDEPELHLHADAQHSLRKVLEGLGAMGRTQVIYTTHSPCMINTMRPRTVRLMQRVKSGNDIFSQMVDSPYGDGFFSVRSSLGISPADSLLFSPVTVLVEGKTEVLCLPQLFEKLVQNGDLPEAEVESVLSHTVFLESIGVANIPNLIRIARSHGSKVVAFIDGDQSSRWKEQLKKCDSSVPLIECVQGGEFEELLPRQVYFEALKAEYSETAGTISLEGFETWEAQLDERRKRLNYTNNLCRWLTAELGMRGLEKPMVMKKAIELAEPKQIASVPLVALFRAIAEQLD